MPQVLHRLVPSYLPRSDPSMTKRKPAQLPYRGTRRQLPLTTVGRSHRSTEKTWCGWSTSRLVAPRGWIREMPSAMPARCGRRCPSQI